MVPLRQYVRGARLNKADLAGMGVGKAQAARMAGMVNFRALSRGGGGRAQSSSMTFRAMVEGSKGWSAPAVAGKHPARPVADQVFKKAMKQDVKALLGHEQGGLQS